MRPAIERRTLLSATTIVLLLVGGDYRFVNRLTRIFYDGRFYDYPLKPMNALRNMGIVTWLRVPSASII